MRSKDNGGKPHITEELMTYLNFPDHTGCEARRMRRERDAGEEEDRAILTPEEEDTGHVSRVTGGQRQHQQQLSEIGQGQQCLARVETF